MDAFDQKIKELNKKRRRHRGLAVALLCLSVLVIAGIYSIFSRSAIAMTRKVTVLDCSYTAPVGVGYAGYAIHIHNEDCYDEDGALVCPLPEIYPHVHNADCYEISTVLSCGQQEAPGHVHDDSCYTTVRGELSCGLEESEEHVHSDACYEWRRELSCSLDEGEGGHQHSDACYTTTARQVCGQQEKHIHSDACYDASGQLVCGLLQLEEHVHGPQCFQEVRLSQLEAQPELIAAAEPEEETSDTADREQDGAPAETPAIDTADLSEKQPDLTADVEEPWVYESAFAALDLSGPWEDNLVAVAKTQLGYTRSSRNFQLDAYGQKQYYSRYGAWYGLPYGDWSAMFVSFCLHYAGIPTEVFPAAYSVPNWIDELYLKELYAPATSYTPKAGDIIFFDCNGDGSGDQAGIVTRLFEEGGVAKLETIEGDRSAAVERFTYDRNDETILGYGILPERPAEEPDDGQPEDLPLTEGSTPAEDAVQLTGGDDTPAQPEEAEVNVTRLSGDEAAKAMSQVEAFLADQVIEDAPVPMARPKEAMPKLDLPAEGRPFLKTKNALESTPYFAASLTAQESGDEDAALAVFDSGVNQETRYEVFDIRLKNEEDGEGHEAGFHVSVSLPAVVTGKDFHLYHIAETGVEELEAELDGDENRSGTLSVSGFSFVTESFSPFVLSYTVETYYQSSRGENYKITLDYGMDADLPEGASLAVAELSADSDEYAQYIEASREILGWEAGALRYARLFDIGILDDAGMRVQPAPGAEVSVKIQLADKGELIEPAVVHFGDETEIVDARTNGDTVSFSTGGFSVYAIVDAPEPVPETGWNRVATVEQIAQLGVGGFYMRHADGYYFTGEMYSPANGRTGIAKIKPAATDPDSAPGAVKYYFEQLEDSSNQFYVYCLDGDVRMYIQQEGNSLRLTEGLQPDTNKATSVFTIENFPNAENTFHMLGVNGYYWNMQGSANGNGFCAYTGGGDANAKIQLEFYATQDNDPYGLDGKSFGIAYNDESATAAGLTASGKTVSGKQRLADQKLVIRPDVLDNDGYLLMAEGTEIPMWTFENDHEDKYYISTQVDGEAKYLSIVNAEVILVDSREAASLITATPGTGAYSGKWHFTVDGYSLNLSSVGNGFNGASGSGATTWMNLVKESDLQDDSFQYYTAKKVSVSDALQVADGQQVVLYTRIWNETKRRYEFFAVDYDGSLIRCYDTGDNIEWIGTNQNTALWEFVEYKTNNVPNYYYELQNTQYGNYIAPQIAGGQIFSDNTIGVNLNGRRYGENYTTIIAWDDVNYAYVGLKTENGHIVSCPLSEAEDFYFAVIHETDLEDELKPVTTVDSDAYGITMRMIDFNNDIVNERDSVQHAFFGSRPNTNGPDKGLLSTNLNEDGYPSTTAITGEVQSLSNLFDDMTPVNHLFLQSIYNESGYFEYDSTSNFAHLNENGTFTVYDQIAAIGTDTGKTRTHGQFMPYNKIFAGQYAYNNSGVLITNQTDVSGNPLADSNPRKGEALYRIPAACADYFFGMEMSAEFTQTADGLDAWGHDIIFEFSGDDDFWFYVDGELVLDLGGVHSALTGSVNFRTGEVICNGTETTLYNLFKSNYQARGMGEAAINEKLNEIFVAKQVDGKTVYTFKDYTNHEMKMFYMERGAGASNLHMRFNLAAVKPGTFILSKKLSGTDNEANDLIEFPYQIFYESSTDGDWHQLDTAAAVLYKGTSTPVRYEAEFTPSGGNRYEHVFFLKPGQSAEVTLPDDAVGPYYVMECGVNTQIFDAVSANGAALTGTAAGNSREDYAVPRASLKDRSQVDFDNHVREGAMRTLSLRKGLYDQTGQERLSYQQDDTLFTFRLSLGDENADAASLPRANLYPYYVRDPGGNYCRWNAGTQKFEPLLPHIDNYADLTRFFADNNWTASQKETVIFKTSMNGSISKIPVGYTVEVRDLIVTTQYKVEELDWEIPRGYTLRSRDGYTRIYPDGSETPAGDSPYGSTIQEGEDPLVEIRNQMGWGLTAHKVWTDKDFVTDRAPIYFAIYVKTNDPDNPYILYPGSIRQLSAEDTDVYFFFQDLVFNNINYRFSDFEVREVTLSGEFTVDENTGKVSGHPDVRAIPGGGTLISGAVPAGKTDPEDFTYTVHYTVGQATGLNENVRDDTVMNARPGIQLYKTDLEGNPLAGAVFTLKDALGNDVALERYTSAQDGLITVAYLSSGTYTLTEIKAPSGYVALDHPLIITVDEEDRVSVQGDTSLFVLSTETEGMLATIYIKDRLTDFLVKKVDSKNHGFLQGAHFALYRQLINNDGLPQKAYRPEIGFEDIETDANGTLPGINMNLGAGTYYLTETSAPEGYTLRTEAEDVCFTIGADGTVTINSSDDSWLSSSAGPDGKVSYVLHIPNVGNKNIRIFKVCTGGSVGLEGAVFALYKAEDFDDEAMMPREDAQALPLAENSTDSAGYLDLGNLAHGEYRLVESQAPAGYLLKTAPVEITVTADGVSYQEGSSLSQDGNGLEYDPANGVYTLTVTNSTGYELPATGGPGTLLHLLLGGGLSVFAALTLLKKRRA
ncbi:MAG: hypothetical protein IJ179_04050 [Oscillospiraceae bacterium]|nr:hypothetical protein [Oscillospiraceae bacterium]